MRKTLFFLILKVFGLSKSTVPAHKKGLIIILIDGLSHNILRQAIRKKYCSFIKGLLTKNYHLHDYYCPPPASTAATEAELFFGESNNIPGFAWFDRTLMRFIRGNRGEVIDLFENIIPKKTNLLEGGTCIFGVYNAGATQYSLSGKELTMRSPFHILKKMQYVLIIFLNPVRFFYILYLILKSFLQSFLTLIKMGSLKLSVSLLKDSFSRIFLGNIGSYIGEIEILRETPILFIDFVLYDEFAHEYGVDNRTSFSSLRLIDWYCKSLYKATKKTKRHYDVIIMSDHGQTPSKPINTPRNITFEQMFSLALDDKSRNITCSYMNASIKLGKDVYLVPAGSSMQVYFSERLQKPYILDEISKLYPALISKLLNMKEVGWVLVRVDHEKRVLFGKHGNVEFVNGKIVTTTGKPFAQLHQFHVNERIIQSLAHYSTFQNNGDIVLFGDVDHNGTLFAFEEHKGTHGGFYGEMTKPFIITDIKQVAEKLEKNSDMATVFEMIRSSYQ